MCRPQSAASTIAAAVADVTARELSPADLDVKAKANPAARRFGRSNPYHATVTTVCRLCKPVEPGDKDTVQVQLDLQTDKTGLVYTPGDALGVIPENGLEAVQEILCFFRATGSELVDTPTWSHCGDEGSMRLADALRCCYDLHSPKPALLTELLAHMPSGDPQERDDIPWCKQRQMLVNLVEILKPSSTWSAE
eukprot:CAMPEP_0117684678 /NCGR_PEP_ID=MMETSP0804-20121206/21252_1 /TAXON_ID=1074897 /ORGANISM="Tetraselmis astigmatica, Strain CCMP880" /LENGTH=193 /DNA_ID=CAMNT_0005495735 /DNA_START=775 /DNA_END=1353 /DNA_ORIENTATION=-